jgi:hypothetical protein
MFSVRCLLAIYRSWIFVTRTTRGLTGFSHIDRRSHSPIRPTIQFCSQPSQARASCSSADESSSSNFKKTDSLCYGTSFCPVQCYQGSPPKSTNHLLILKHGACRL